MLTPEQIAKEAAEAYVTLGKNEFGMFLAFDSRPTEYIDPRIGGDPENFLGHYRRDVEKIILAAVERALREVPVPGGLSAERVAEIREMRAERETRSYRDESLIRAVDDLLAGHDHLARALHDCGQDRTAAVWASGYEAGKASAVETIQRFVAAMPDGAESASVAFHLGRVAAAIMGLGEAAREKEA